MKYYTIGIQLYSDELYPHDYSDGQENVYDLTEDQYNHFVNTKWESVYDLEDYIKKTTSDPDCVNEAEEYTKGLCQLDQTIFDYSTQEYLEISQ